MPGVDGLGTATPDPDLDQDGIVENTGIVVDDFDGNIWTLRRISSGDFDPRHD